MAITDPWQHSPAELVAEFERLRERIRRQTHFHRYMRRTVREKDATIGQLCDRIVDLEAELLEFAMVVEEIERAHREEWCAGQLKTGTRRGLDLAAFIARGVQLMVRVHRRQGDARRRSADELGSANVSNGCSRC